MRTFTRSFRPILLCLSMLSVSSSLAFAEPTAAADEATCAAAAAAKPAPGVRPDPNGAAACFRQGERAAAGDDRAAMALSYGRACQLGNGLACIHLGNGVEPDEAKRPALLTRAAAVFRAQCDGGDAEGCYYLGIACERGRGVEQDEKQALARYHQACAAGYTYGCTSEGGMYLAGKGTPVDLARAAEVYTRACEQGDLFACYWVGHIHERELGAHTSHVQTAAAGDLEVRVIEAGVETKPATPRPGPALTALRALDRAKLRAGCAAKRGFDCYRLGMAALLDGDARQAAERFGEACAAGSGWGCLKLGDCRLHGWGVPRDLGGASSAYLMVCDEGVGGREGYAQECRSLTERMGL